jgi:hypothetical protein
LEGLRFTAKLQPHRLEFYIFIAALQVLFPAIEKKTDAARRGFSQRIRLSRGAGLP